MEIRREKKDFMDLIGDIEFVVHEASDDAGLSHRLIPQEHQLVLG